jgi:hypothetical protein
MQEEPKWGQLATCGEIINEINALDFTGLTLLEQARLIADHFECSSFYTRDGNDCLAYDLAREHFCLTPRYVYSTNYGWIDFHHVYRIFEWAIEQAEGGGMSLIQAANIASMTGYEGEVVQWLKNNESGFSYEDLCSNHIGAMFFINHYEDIMSGQLTWSGALTYACSVMPFRNPSEAPNYQFIPHVLDNNLPHVYNNTNCLTGENLREEHRQSFQKKPLSVQMNIRQVHFEFPD